MLIYINLEGAVRRWEKSFVIIAYLKQGVSDERAQKTMEILRNIKEVKKIEYVNSEEAMRKFKQQLGDDAFLLEGIENNILPGYFVITPAIDDVKVVEPLIDSIRKVENIEDIQYEKDVVLRFVKALSTIKLLSWVLNIFVLVTVIFIISNTIRLSFFARKDEIEIMKLVGASDLFVGAPYVIESLWQNLLSILISLVLLFFLYSFLLQPLSDSLSFLFGISGFSFFDKGHIIMIVLMAIMVGFFGSFIAIRRYLHI